MKKIIPFYLFITALFFTNWIKAQSSLPLSLYSSSDTSKPLIFYISGDGGFNKFSSAFMETLNKEGYALIGLDAKEYFWKKKKPQEAADAIEAVIDQYNKEWKRKNIVLIGYSFGADVAPFVLTHFSKALSGKINHLVLMSPSSKTDFEIHVLQMFGWGKNNGESVPDEVSKITKQVSIFEGDDEDDFPYNQLTNKNKQLFKMPGGHHYDGDVTGLCKKIISVTK